MRDFPFDNSFVREMQGFYEPSQPEPSAQPELLYFNDELARQLGLDLQNRAPEELAELFVGNRLPEGAEPIAQVYAGHQFGQFNPRLGDGRALIIGEVIDRNGKRRDIAFKGSGRTPYSRAGDGKAAIGPMLREVLVSEAMHALGVPTTRSLAVVASGEPVYRERQLPGAVLTRVAASHIRIGTFEFFAARGEREKVRQLADYSIARHYPGVAEADNPYLELLRAVIRRQSALVAQWVGLGFIHGVMNTDNMAIAGETIDYGPCAFMEAYEPSAVFSSIDRGGRYAYKNQSAIAQWNLARFAETLLPLIAEEQSLAIELATQAIQSFSAVYQQHWLDRMRAKLGLDKHGANAEQDKSLIEAWFNLLESQQIDFTLAWRYLVGAAEGNPARLRTLFADPEPIDAWLDKWRAYRDVGQGNHEAQVKTMREVNPWLVPRNHLVEKALNAASDGGDLIPFENLLSALQRPYDERDDARKFAEPAAKEFTASYQTFCGT